MKTILFPTDFAINNALAWVKYFARQYSAGIHLLHVHRPALPDTTLPTMGDLGVGAMTTLELEDIGRENLHKFAAQLETEGFSVQTDWRIGGVEDEIVRAAHELDADLIITGRAEMTGFFDRMMGSAATDVARAATCPVLVVPNGPDGEPAPQPHIGQITYASQLEFDERESMLQAVAVAKAFGAQLSLVKVNADNQLNLYDDEQFMAQLQQQHAEIAFDVDTVKARSVTSGLTDYLRENPTDLLVMTTRERGFLANLINPSETERMLERADVPVLVLHG
jgi:nucleotide-binding universal stress UspA family protein